MSERDNSKDVALYTHWNVVKNFTKSAMDEWDKNGLKCRDHVDVIAFQIEYAKRFCEIYWYRSKEFEADLRAARKIARHKLVTEYKDPKAEAFSST